MAAYGYRNIRMPIVEQTDLFVRSIGAVTDIVEKEMYTFLDHLNGESLTLRPEGTASCVRAVLEHNLLYAGPQRLVLFRADVSPRAAAKRPLPAVPSGGVGAWVMPARISMPSSLSCAPSYGKSWVFPMCAWRSARLAVPSRAQCIGTRLDSISGAPSRQAR